MSGTTRPQAEWETIDKRWNPSLTVLLQNARLLALP